LKDLVLILFKLKFTHKKFLASQHNLLLIPYLVEVIVHNIKTSNKYKDFICNNIMKYHSCVLYYFIFWK